MDGGNSCVLADGGLVPFLALLVGVYEFCGHEEGEAAGCQSTVANGHHVGCQDGGIAEVGAGCEGVLA